MTSDWRDVLTERVGSALTGSETNTSSGGVSREPSAAAYTTANTKVLSQSTSKTGRQKPVQGVWTQMEINHTNGAQVNYHSRFIFMPSIIQQTLFWFAPTKTATHPFTSATFTFDRFLWGVEGGRCNAFLFLQSLLDNRQSRLFIWSVTGRFNFREHSFHCNNELLTGVYWLTVPSMFPAATCFPFGLQQTG